MTFESFKEVYKDENTKNKVLLLIHQMQYADDNRVNAATAQNPDDRKYYSSEYDAMYKRIDWLYKEIIEGIERLEEQKCGS